MIYQTFSAEDFQRFHRTYLTSSSDWALRDFGKPGLENSGAQSDASLSAVRQACDIRKTKKAKRLPAASLSSKMPGSMPVLPGRHVCQLLGRPLRSQN
ncbi:MAG: DUF5054 domain-containing protein [Alistipes indistinctus]